MDVKVPSRNLLFQDGKGQSVAHCHQQGEAEG